MSAPAGAPRPRAPLGSAAAGSACLARAASGAGGRLLSNGRYAVLIGHTGTGRSTWGAYALTRWTPDPIDDRSGLAIWLRDRDGGPARTLGREPLGRGAERYETTYSPGRFTITRLDDGLETRLEVCVAPDADAELRRVTLVNHSPRTRRIVVTTATEIVLHDAAADEAHPAFAKLFVQTEFVASARALLARRRPRGSDETHPLLVHALLEPGPLEAESDRTRWLARGSRTGPPPGAERDEPLSGTTGNVLDPIACLRREVSIAPGARVELTFLLGVAPDRDAALALTERFGAPGVVATAFAQAQIRAQETALAAGVRAEDAEALQALAIAVLQGEPALRTAAASLRVEAPEPGAPGALGLSAHRPLVLALEPAAGCAEDRAALAAARRYWRALGIDVDVIALAPEGAAPEPEPGIVMRTREELGEATLSALAAVAAAVLVQPLAAAATASLSSERLDALAPPAAALPPAGSGAAAPNGETLREYNGYGGFSADGSEYVIRMPWRDGGPALPPQPWVNVIAGPEFGFLVSETGAGCTWSANSREHRLTPWSNDPVRDPHEEAYYLRDEGTGEWWSPLAGPAPQPGGYEMRHGFGYSIARHSGSELEQEVTLFAHRDAPLRVTRVRVTNRGTRPRTISFHAYQRLVLGVTPGASARSIVTAHEPDAGLLLARNPMAGEFAGQVAVAAVVAPSHAATPARTGDRVAFLGPNGSPARPASVADGTPLEERFGAGLDACFAQRLTLEIAPGASGECAFLLGEFATVEAAREAVFALRERGAVERALEAARLAWRERVSGIRIETPSPAIDLMVNGWLAYQTLSCRIWGRTAFYQSGGAFGFRDQLQDACSLLMLDPALAREQILLHAAHQFVEGDVLHWWHPPLAKGIRTRFADDLLWLPLLTAYYVAATGDWSVLDERLRFLQAEPLAEGEDERFIVPRDSGRSADLYEHCCRAIDRSFALGAHGLPLFGTGDWNDGMNRVGREGRGESVWMGFFLYAILGDFGPVCERRGDTERAARYARFRDTLRKALDDGGWDGEWYRRAYFDDGEPLGTRGDTECRIDGLAQAWAVISRAAPPERARSAMDAVERYLVSERDGIIRLLTPAFENTPHDPGYIKGYVPGVRENGGQYTHAALWVVRAFAELGRRDEAARLLEMLSPVAHARDADAVARYRVEPYVVAADVYGEPPHVGRGGWTWYTGSSGWMLRVAIESLLGIRLVRGRALSIRPNTPDGWPEFRVSYRVPGQRTMYEIHVRAPEGRAGAVLEARLDGQPLALEDGAAVVPLAGDDATHRVEVVLGETAAPISRAGQPGSGSGSA